ncbi:AAA family ATPase [Solirubrobacter sp. CPCC 204708]|uniref:AAA family ATPase n=1 Tax=Solirubrobacter deserti TaxID=2282478 RepID=A0ABT4RE60_9ACTN|nr:AAA family ATPase [Solirubrobacter deserti]MBE2316055.1 AAA family ATPase [Solirubrobacter deserti]MDA0136807.1 AAA family ATPase [Solirubrobacter deserti]
MTRRRRDIRRFGPGPYLHALKTTNEPRYEQYEHLYTVLAHVDQMSFEQPVTLLAGDNGSGKSTVIEACAAAMGFDEQGGELERLGELPAVPSAIYKGFIEPVVDRWSRPRIGYFLRAESFFNVAEFVDREGQYSPDLSLYGDVPLHQQSHGQSFLALASNRFGGEGLFILDEPEAALSVTGALALVTVIANAARAGAQFVIATHSPILLAVPGAKIYELSEDHQFAETEYDDLDAVRLMRGFLDAPERYLRAALGE